MRPNLHKIPLFLVFLSISGCVTNRALEKKLLQKDEYLLETQKIEGNLAFDDEQLKPLLRQKTNRKTVVNATPYLWYYYIGSLLYVPAKAKAQLDSAEAKLDRYKKGAKVRKGKLSRLEKRVERKELKVKEGNWVMRVMGEPPVVWDPSLTNESVTQLKNFYDSKGYFKHKISVTWDTNKRRIKQKFKIVEGPATRINDLQYRAENAEVEKIIKESVPFALVRVGMPFDENRISLERDRIEKLLRNSGYFDFTKSYITVVADTTQKSNAIALIFDIQNPKNGLGHKRYTVRKIYIEMDLNLSLQTKIDTVLYKGVYFLQQKDRFAKGVIFRKLRFFPNDYYNQQSVLLTQRQLNSLENFKYINITFRKDTTLQDTHLEAFIVLRPTKKYQISDDWGLKVSQGFPGPFANIIFTSRNAFRGCENVDVGVRAGIEGIASVLDVTKVYTSTEYGANLGITFPELLAPNYWRRKLSDFYPKTRLSAGYSNTIRPEYIRGTVRFNYSYSYQTQPYNRFNISLWDFNVVQSRIQNDLFTTYLNELFEQGNPLKNSFNNSLISNISFNFTYSTNNIALNNRSQYFSALLESGGTTANLFRSYLQELSNRWGISYFQYIKLNFDYRNYFPLSKRSTLVFRANIGYAQPYGLSNTLPYEKFFFAGGSNSIRAWRPRRLGPGEFDPGRKENGAIQDRNEQPGEILLEGNVEYRFPIYKFIEGALFADAGNVWKGPSATDQREGVKLSSSFYNQIAVGVGAGIRLNFNFLIFRLDVASKLWDPAYEDIGKRYVLYKWDQPDQTLLNIGIGYPF